MAEKKKRKYPSAISTHHSHPEHLTEKQQLFLKEYLSNGERAVDAYAVVLGKRPEDMSKGQKRSAYNAYLGNAKIKAILARARAKIVARTEIMIEKYAASKERVLEELAQIAFTKPTDIMEWGPDGVKVKPSSEISPEAASAITDVSEYGSKGNKKVHVKLADKRAALVDLGKALGLFVDKHQHEHKAVSVSFIVEKE